MINVQAQGTDFLIYEDKILGRYCITSPIPKFWSWVEGKNKAALGAIDQTRYRIIATIKEGEWFCVDQ